MIEPLTGEYYEQNFAAFMDTVTSGEFPDMEPRCAICLTDDPNTLWHCDDNIRRAGLRTGGVLCDPCYDRYADALYADPDSC